MQKVRDGFHRYQFGSSIKIKNHIFICKHTDTYINSIHYTCAHQHVSTFFVTKMGFWLSISQACFSLLFHRHHHSSLSLSASLFLSLCLLFVIVLLTTIFQHVRHIRSNRLNGRYTPSAYIRETSPNVWYRDNFVFLFFLFGIIKLVIPLFTFGGAMFSVCAFFFFFFYFLFIFVSSNLHFMLCRRFWSRRVYVIESSYCSTMKIQHVTLTHSQASSEFIEMS